ncbi:N-acetylglucosamine-6-phosphate deacetylase [Luteococcus sp.]|uniref:N-acetylglucosamine-6-phosphate deacetylase n=1 Tax=Luteococcus sp. TaxID=1969402 RepID=UPI003736718E
MAMIACRQVVTGLAGHPQELTLRVDEGRIVRLEEGINPDAVLLEGWLVPGFVDTHCHGAAGAVFAAPEVDDAMRALLHHRRHGSTTVVASAATRSLDVLLDEVERLRLLVDLEELAGIHVVAAFLEGRGDDDDPAAELQAALAEVVAAAGQSLLMVTLPPERPGALEATRSLCEAGVTVAVGHTSADDVLTREAIEAGMRVATHLFNAMPEMRHLDPGPVPVLLTDDRVTCELVCDGAHVDENVVRLAIRAAGIDQISLVSDAMSLSGHADGAYELGGMPVQVIDQVVRTLNLDATPGAVAGSTLTMDRAFSFVVGLGFSVVEASRMASTTPARAHGLTQVGRLAPGTWADLCQVDEDGRLQAVMRRGNWLDGP